MAFRRDGDKVHEWKRWLTRNRAELIRAGVPDEILRDERRWGVFLESGGWDAESGFKVDMLSLAQARELHALLLREYGPRLSDACIQILARRINTGVSSPSAHPGSE